MIDPNTATAQECADWLAGDDGWTWRNYAGFEDERLWTHPDGREELEYRHGERLENEHGPYKLTLDGAAGAAKPPWKLAKVCCIDGLYNCTLWKNAGSICTIENAPDELTARYRAAVAARLAGMEGRG